MPIRDREDAAEVQAHIDRVFDAVAKGAHARGWVSLRPRHRLVRVGQAGGEESTDICD